jgi:hypothetical protein
MRLRVCQVLARRAEAPDACLRPRAARYRAGPLCAPAQADAAPLRWQGPAALVVCVLRGDDATPLVRPARLWEFPLPAGTGDGPAGAAALPPPRLAATWTDAFVGPPRMDNPLALDADVVVGPELCRDSASMPCIMPEGGIALRDCATGTVAPLQGAEAVTAASLRSIRLSARPGGARHVLLESRMQRFMHLDADAGALLGDFVLPCTQRPLMHLYNFEPWLPAAGRTMLTGQLVSLPYGGSAAADAVALRAATQYDGLWTAANTAAERAAAVEARTLVTLLPSVVLYRIIDCASGALGLARPRQ